jgi:hypothetical protein
VHQVRGSLDELSASSSVSDSTTRRWVVKADEERLFDVVLAGDVPRTSSARDLVAARTAE